MTDLLAEVLALIDDEVWGESDLGAGESHLHKLCAAVVRAVPTAGATLSVMTGDGTNGVAIASDPASKLMAELQTTLGEGPGIDAYTLRRPVLEPDLTDGAVSRWPSYTQAALGAGMAAVFSFPLQVGGARLGVLDLHRREPGSLSGAELKLALTFAEVAVRILLDGHGDGDGLAPHGLEQAMDNQSELYQAQGMVKVQLGVSLEESMARLRAHAFATDRRLMDVASDVVSRTLRLDRDGG